MNKNYKNPVQAWLEVARINCNLNITVYDKIINYEQIIN
jgi:hypothetical protein